MMKLHRYSEKSLKLMTNNPLVMDTLGWIYYKKDLYTPAISELTGCVDKMPNNATVHYHLGMAYYKKGDKVHAKELLLKALSLKGNFDGADKAMIILEKLYSN